jgi:hypothetical protein
MSQSLLNKIWSFLALLLLYLCLNVWSITQQWQLSFPGNPFKVANVTPDGGTIYGVPICGMFLILVSVVTRIRVTLDRAAVGKQIATLRRFLS